VTESGKRAAKSILGYPPQELGLYLELTAAQFVDYMAILKGLDDSFQGTITGCDSYRLCCASGG
jgi:ABC-type multidrug transport system ATPase subunit